MTGQLVASIIFRLRIQRAAGLIPAGLTAGINPAARYSNQRAAGLIPAVRERSPHGGDQPRRSPERRTRAGEMARTLALLIVGLGFGLLVPPVRAAAPEWGTVKGQVVFGGAKIPEPKPIDVGNNPDKQHCLSQGPLLSEEWVINKANKGVRWAFVWLAPATSSESLPVHPSLKEIEKKEVEIDQPACKFIPHALGLRQGQVLLAKNSAPVAHNINWTGLKNPGGNSIIAPGQSYPIANLIADRFPVKLACNIHPWMSAWVRVFDHPYFAVTDANGKFEIKLAPAGNYHLMSWQEVVGYGPGGRQGVPVTIKGGADTDVGKLELKPTNNK